MFSMLLIRRCIQMHFPCLICVSSGWLSTCNLLLEESDCPKCIWSINSTYMSRKLE
ncbi:hypothetical protein GLYMA_04G073551v4 [Glycine max]|nr:hypothetical protein GLYMA_04G073551v4 [Glycine max]KAH1110250.1 hypothetical protein GYH30_009225 [Glycine max]